MASEMDIRNININYHRNGVGGEGFFAIHFTSTSDDGDPEKLIAVIVPHDDDETNECKCDGRCYVVRPTNPELCYRGDHFESDMRLIVKAQRIKWRTEFDKALITSKPFTGEIMFKDMVEVMKTIYPDPVITEVLKPSNKRFADIV